MNTTLGAERQSDEAFSRRSVISQLTRVIENQLSPGDLAELRRLRPEDPASPAFWKLCATVLTAVLPGRDGPLRDEAERRWAIIVRNLVHLRGLHRPDRPLGQALGEAGLSESRFLRLLRARGAVLNDVLRGVVHLMAQKAEPADLTQLADLVLDQDGERGEAVRRRIARAFYSSETVSR